LVALGMEHEWSIDHGEHNNVRFLSAPQNLLRPGFIRTRRLRGETHYGSEG
jgi:hypothetical protein